MAVSSEAKKAYRFLHTAYLTYLTQDSDAIPTPVNQSN